MARHSHGSPTSTSSRSRAARLWLFAAAACVSACTAAPPAEAPKTPEASSLAKGYAAALAAEAQDSTAAGPYLDLLDLAIANPHAPGALPAGIAALDALVTGSTGGFDAMGPTAIAFRSREGFPRVVERLRHAWAAADRAPLPGPDGTMARPPALAFLRGSVAAALHEMALFQGDSAAAEVWTSRRGCAATATAIAPLDWTPLRGLDTKLPIGPDDPIQKSYPGIQPFAAAIEPEVLHADRCLLDVNTTSFLQGTRAIVVDVIVPFAQTIHLALTSASAAVVEVGGVPALTRAFEAGGRPVERLASIRVPEGTVRVVVKIAQKGEGSLVELDILGDDGLPLRTHAPRPGESAKSRAIKASAVEISPLGASEDEALLTAAGLLALGEVRAAEHLLEEQKAPGSGATAPSSSPGLALLYSRAIESAEDLPETKMTERIRASLDRVLAAWPKSWEGRVGHARATERRRGLGEGATQALRELGATPADATKGDKVTERDRMLTAYTAVTARRTSLPDVAEKAYTELAAQAPGSPLLASVDARLHTRVGASVVEAACRGGLPRAETDCLDALRERGDFAAALVEIERLRKLRDAPEGLRDLELNVRIRSGDLPGALALHDAMHPAERRMLDALGFAAGRGDRRATQPRLMRDRLASRDAPYAIDPLVRLLGLELDPAPRLEAEGRKLVLADQKEAFLPGAATAVLRHTEQYKIDATGLVHYTTYDLRRVSGTTDVAGGGVTYGPTVDGRGAPKLLRKRIHKVDGRVLEPDAAANAAQASDLSQLEAGDYIEQITDGWALPGDTGQLVIDTPDLLPERTSVREATIEIRRATSIPFTIWAHPLLGAAKERVENGFTVSTWEMKNQAPRRIEDGVPKLERSCSVSLGTQTWEQVARAAEENLRSLEEQDPYVTRWANEAAGDDKKPSRALVERIVAAVGKKVKIASSGELSDVAAVYGGGSQHLTARTILELGQGSRSWVVYRALRELGVKVELAIAETEPFSASANFPPHVGRFRHALVIAHPPEGDLWIDADVEGPPLPPGRISPELRGRSALVASRGIVTVEGASSEAGDEVDVRLALDDKGDAKGTFTVLLHGRTAQTLAEAFETVVGSDRQEMLRGVVLGWVPWADVDDVTVSSTEGSWEVALRASIAVHGYGRPEGKGGKTWVLAGLEPVHIVFPRATVGTLGATYASRGARQNALSIDAPIQYHMHRRIELPAGAKITRAPTDLDVRGPNLTASRKTTSTGQVLEDSFTLSLPTGTVAAESYPIFVSKVQAVDDGFMAGTRVQVKP
jgi:hypothetical protein